MTELNAASNNLITFCNKEAALRSLPLQMSLVLSKRTFRYLKGGSS